MNEEGLQVAIYTPPFEPKRIRLTNGETYEIRQPGTIAIGRRTSAVVVDGLLHTIANIHIAQIEPTHRRGTIAAMARDASHRKPSIRGGS